MTARLWLKHETDLARLFWLAEPGLAAKAVPGLIWVPRSVTPYIRKEPVSPKMNCLGRACEVTIEDWWWDKNGRGVTKDGQLEMTMEMENER